MSINIKKISNKLKKEKLLFRSKVKTWIESSNVFFDSLELLNDYEVFDIETTNIINLKLRSLGLDSKGKAINNNGLYVDIDSNYDDYLSRVAERFQYIDNVYVYLFPRENLGSLSILISSYDLFSNLKSIMDFYDDDINIHQNDFSNSLFLTVDRLGDEISNLEIVKSGKTWNKLI